MALTRRAMLASLAGAGHAAGQTVKSSGQATIGFKADTMPQRSECGIGALMPWADVLWAVTYNSHKKGTGYGLGLYAISENLDAQRLHVHDGTHANRLIHRESNQCFIGPYVIDAKGNWKHIPALDNYRLTSTMRHLTDGANRIYYQGMEGEFIEMDVSDHKPRVLTDLVKEMKLAARPHFKGGYTAQGRVVVANNGFYAFGEDQAGLFEYDGKAWKKLSGKPHMDVAARQDMGAVLFATGWDEASVLLWALVKGEWQRYRLPKATQAMSHAWQTEWMRIREVETEHYLMDIQGMFYELQPLAFENRIWGVKPVCQHLRIIPDFCAFRGLFAVGGNQTTPNRDNNALSGQPQSGLWFGKTDDLWSWGKPQGWGGPYWKTAVRKGAPSDPFLLTGFVHKMLHITTDKAAVFDVEIDFMGNGTWHKYEQVKVGAEGYGKHLFPDAFSAQWVRLTAQNDCTATAMFYFV
ncbi:MAG: hypothetical protein JNK48_04675 [Bryobacterales bacterium]|nr:hypothetical protein [Bryobacterales bacterium]